MKIRPTLLLCLLGQTLATLTQNLPTEIFNPGSITNADVSAALENCDDPSVTVAACISSLKTLWDNDWPALDAAFDHQIDCWQQFATAFGYNSFTDMIELPWTNTYNAFYMPNTRHYEHFYDQVGCNQIWNMGRGGVQPDAITFYDVPAHEHNVLYWNDATRITPWISHDELVLQFFGITDTCVELYAEQQGQRGQALTEGQWRIEYYNATGHVYINSTDLGKDALDAEISTFVEGGLENTHVHICRTPFYLQICLNENAPVNKGVGGCPIGCEYFPAFTASDDSLSPYTHHGIFDVHCEAGDIMSFNGTRSGSDRDFTDDDFFLDPPEAKTPELWLEDKCESENFLLLDGQEVHIKGSLQGTLEIVIHPDICERCGTATAGLCAINALNFENPLDPDDDGTTYTYAYLCDATFAETDPVRFFVYATKGAHSLCDGTCFDSESLVCPEGTEDNSLAFEPFVASNRTILAGNAAGLMEYDGDGTEEVIVATVGASIIDSADENDVIEDHNGQSLLVGGPANDTLISRGGRDALWGGNEFMFQPCTDSSWGPNMDANGDGDCGAYETDPTTCGSFDNDDITVADLCCICGGGEGGTVVTVAAENSDSDLDPTMFTLGDQDLYVIYPTTEKSLYDAALTRETADGTELQDWPLNGRNTKSRQNECTKIFGIEAQDTIQFRLDDPTVEDHKFTNDDDECAVEIDGWEIIWRLGAAYVEGETSLHVHYSRKDNKAVICPNGLSFVGPVAADNDGSDNQALWEALVPTSCRAPLDQGELNSFCFEVPVECPDLDPWPETDVDEYLKNKNILNWYGWGW